MRQKGRQKRSKNDFQTFNAGERPPWAIGWPQKPFVAMAEQIGATTLDAGCGTGENALSLASRGKKVTGVDFVDEAIRRAKQKAQE